MKSYIPCGLLTACILTGGVIGPSSRAQSITAPTTAAVAPREFINTWLVAGTFDNQASSGIARDGVKEDEAEPRPCLKIGGQAWKYFDDRLFNRNYDDYQDLYSYFAIKLKSSAAAKMAYVHTYIYSENEQSVRLKMGADTSCLASLNGATVMEITKAGWAKDSADAPVVLKKGWNSLLLNIANVQNGRFGFYARLCDANGAAIPGLIYSVYGPNGPLAVTTSTMDDLNVGTMPVGWREWPYVGAHPDPRKIDSGEDSGSLLKRFVTNRNLLMEATDFCLQAAGGKPPYAWTIVDGALPEGLALGRDGRVTGVIEPYAKLQNYPFVVKVTDAEGGASTKSLSIEVRERPNKWYEEARLVALSHSPESIPADGYGKFAKLVKDCGYQVIMPISYNNGDYRFRYPSKFAPPGTEDVIGRLKTALNAEGVRMGMYFGALNVGTNLFTPLEQGLMVEDAILKYKPVAIWLDLTLQDSEAPDALYSMVRTLDENLVIVVNGNLGTHGDWDEICFEGWTAWGDNMWEIWPVEVPWPKKHAPESWRWLTTPYMQEKTMAMVSDWQEYLRVQLSLIGEGYIANVDMTYEDGSPKTREKYGGYFVELHGKMAAWSNPAGAPSLVTSFTQVNPGPLAPADWGYNVINIPRDTIYLHLIKNARRKSGVPADPALTVGPLNVAVKSITWMNTNQPVKFIQPRTSTNHNVEIDLTGITPDPVDTIFRIELAEPIPGPQPPQGVPKGNLATYKPARLLSPDGKHILGASTMAIPGGPKRGVDGDPLTASIASGSYAWSYEVDLQRIHSVDRITVNQSLKAYATEFKIRVSNDGEEWKEVAHERNGTGGAAKFSFPAAKVRFVQVCFIKPDAAGQPGGQGSITELEVYEAEK